MRKHKFYQQKWFIPVVGLFVLVAVVSAASYFQSDYYSGNLRGVATLTGKTAQMMPAPFKGITPSVAPMPSPMTKPIITAPTNGQILTNFPRLVSIEWTDTNQTVTHNVEITCDFCESVTNKWSKPTVYSTAGTLFTAASFPGDNQYRVRVQGVTTTGVTPWSDYVYFSFNTSSQLAQPTQAPELFGPSPNTASTAFTTAKFGNEVNEFEWSGPASNINYYVDYKVCFVNGSVEKCLDANVGQPKGTFINHRALTAAEWASVKSALFGPVVTQKKSPPFHMLWKVVMMATQKSSNVVVSNEISNPWDIWIYF